MLTIGIFFSTAIVYLLSSLGAAHANLGSLKIPTGSTGSFELLLSSTTHAPEYEQALQLFVGTTETCCNNRTPVAGDYSRVDNRLRFKPQFELLTDQPYTVKWRKLNHSIGLDNEQPFHLKEFAISGQQPVTTPKVVAVYPSGPVIPENTLRFFVHFSTPMSPHLSAENILLLNSLGEVDRAAFMTFKQELWNHDRTQLTILLDPGRIKRGVAQNVKLGSALTKEEKYTLVVNEWPSATGGQSSKHFMKPYEISPALRSLPDTASWIWTYPRKHTRDPLTITFDRPFDYAGLQTAIRIKDSQGTLIDGLVNIIRHETEWQFQPTAAWQGSYIDVVVDAKLEDVAGNNFHTLLDREMTEQEQKSTEPQSSDSANTFQQRIWLRPIQ